MNRLLIFVTMFFPLMSYAKIEVVATTADIGALVKEVGGPEVSVTTIAKGTQDPHFVEAKPSYMVKGRDADLVVSNGLSLEVGWLPSIIRGSRNPKINPGSPGYLELGSLIKPIDVPTGNISRAMGDVHPDGNPHFMLDPIRVGEVALGLATRLGELDSKNKDVYVKRAKDMQARLSSKVKTWQKRIADSGVKGVITYHPTMNYFIERFGLKGAGYLEPKPGVPPTAKHILEIMEKMKAENVKIILVENFFDSKIADRLKNEVSGTKVISVGTSVESAPGLNSADDVIEQLVKAVEGKL